MKKVLLSLTAVALALASVFTSCKKEPSGGDTNKTVATLKQADLVTAVKAMYAAWEEDGVIPETLEIGGKTLEQGQWQYAMFKLLPAMASGDNSDIKVIECKAAAHPERDSYDMDEIAVKNGPADKTGEKEDLVSVCTRILAAAEENAQIPNQVLFTRDKGPIAFSTNRSTISVARAIASDLPEKVSASYVPSSASIKAFMQEFVKVLDLWENNVGTFRYNGDGALEACTEEEAKAANSSPGWGLINVNYIPLDTQFNVANLSFSMADAWEIAVRSYLFLRGYNGDDTEAVGQNSFEPTTTVKNISAPIPVTHDYYFGDGCYNELPGNGGHFTMNGEYHKADLKVLDNFAFRATNYSHGQSISNMCGYPRDGFEEYGGSLCAMRSIYTYASVFKYMLDNNLQVATEIPAETIFRSELFGDEDRQPEPGDDPNPGEEVTTPDVTIGAFAAEYVKLLDIWQANTGNFYVDGRARLVFVDNVADATHTNAHYIPEGTKLTIDGKQYDPTHVLEMALRSYLLLRGKDGNGLTSFPAINPAATMASHVPEIKNYSWAESPYYDEFTSPEPCRVATKLLDNAAERQLKYAANNGYFANFVGYTGGQVEGYGGVLSAQRTLITFAFVFKYMIDNNLSNLEGISADQIFRHELYGDEGGDWGPVVSDPATIGKFAREYVKIIDIWQNTTANVSLEDGVFTIKENAADATYPGAHYVPDNTTISVGGQSYGLAGMLELAMRSFYLLRGKNGNGTTDFPAIDKASTMADELPAIRNFTWPERPYIEATNGGLLTYNDEHCKVNIAWLDNFAGRALKWGYNNGSFANFCGYTGGQVSGFNGCGSTGRALITYAFFFKYLLDNNLDDATALANDTVIRSELFGLE